MKNTGIIEDNEIFQANPTFTSGTDYKTFLKNQLLDDYKDGIRTAKISIFPNDFYYEYSSEGIAKTWKNGEIIEVNDALIFLDKNGESILKKKDNSAVRWHVTSRKIRYEGQVIIDLELQEIASFD